MEKWQKFILEHGHIEAEIIDENTMFFPNFDGNGNDARLVQFPDGSVLESWTDNTFKRFKSVKEWLGY